MTTDCPRCLWVQRFTGTDSLCGDCARIAKRDAEIEAAERQRGEQRDFYLRTSHCGACGQPGTYCICGKPCGCAELHPVGSGLAEGALDQFVEAVSDGQQELFT